MHFAVSRCNLLTADSRDYVQLKVVSWNRTAKSKEFARHELRRVVMTKQLQHFRTIL